MKIDYRAEVLKIYPQAIRYKPISSNYSPPWRILDNTIANGGKEIGRGNSPGDAWENAFNKIKKT